MIDDYQAIVLAEYKRLRKTNELTCDLSTRAKFRKECIKIFNKRYNSKEDDDIFADFFEVDKIEANFHLLLKKSTGDDFKSVHNHIAGYNKTDNTELKNTELLAWFIDFRPRPSIKYYSTINSKDIESDGVHDGSSDLSIDNGDLVDDTAQQAGRTILIPPLTSTKKCNLTAVVSMIILLLVPVIIFIWKYQLSQNIIPNQDEKCMYWTGYYYEPIKCDEIKDGVIVIPLDPIKLQRMRRIPFFVKVTKFDIGKLWWGRIEGQPAYFTDSGINPIDTNKRLLPLTNYMVMRHETKKNIIIDIIEWSYYIVIVVLGGLILIKFMRRKDF